ncbi:poly-beta-1,6 N-acetyl-D-glucosamine synthase, pgaC [Lactococcus cremoris]|nr:poly-beta-1,6 N-acetyl-D-glucosamine synthase, pgaC [Lactococcus cremoris]
MDRKSNLPLVSIIITTFNRINYLKQMLESILIQSYKNVEIIIVDDGSVDNTKNIIREYQLKYKQQIFFFEGKKGPGINRFLAYQKISGEFIVFCDDDDYYTDINFIEKSVNIMYDFQDVSLICFSSDILYVKDNLLETKPLNKKGIFESGEVANNFLTEFQKPNSTFPSFYRRSTFEKNGFTEVKSFNDTNIYLRGILGGKVYYSPQNVGVYRVHSGSIGNSLDPNFIIQVLNEKKILSKYLMTSPQKQEQWLYLQTLNTTDYYADRSSKVEYFTILKWFKLNLSNKYYHRAKKMFIFARIKFLMKKFIKRKNPYI